jgi:SAM-dependent methyltransferase
VDERKKSGETMNGSECWKELGEIDPMYAILSDPRYKQNKWDIEAFYRSGLEDVQKVMTTVWRYSNALPKKRVLDFGCGMGRTTRHFSTYFAECIGLDISPPMIRSAIEHNREYPTVRFDLFTYGDLPYPEDHFDLVYSTLVLQHVYNASEVYRYLTEFHRVIEPGGHLVFQLPDRLTIRGRLQPRIVAYDILRQMGLSASEIYRRFGITRISMLAIPEEEVRKRLDRIGFEVVYLSRIGDDRIYYARKRLTK